MMAKRCEMTGVGPSAGNSISHSRRATRRRWLPNLKRKRIYNPENNRWITIRLTAAALKTIKFKGFSSLQKSQAKLGR